jgi:predicted negative regulator of RcsB-dependent stress response
MTGLYFYLSILIAVFIFLGYRVYKKRKLEQKTYEEREDDVFYDNAKNIRRD